MEAIAITTGVKVNQQTDVSSTALVFVAIFHYPIRACVVTLSLSLSVCWEKVLKYALSKVFTDFILM